MKASKFMEDVLTSAEKKAPMYMEQLQKGTDSVLLSVLLSVRFWKT